MPNPAIGMKVNLPQLPDPLSIPARVDAWARRDAKFAGLLASSKTPTAALARWSLELLAADRAEEGIDAIRSALALAPKDPILWSNYGAALFQGHLASDAVVCIEHSVRILPKQPDAWLLLGMVRKKLGDDGGAEEAYHLALEQEPRSIAAWQLLGLLKEEQKEIGTAIQCLKACIEAGGPTPALLAYVGKLSYNLGRFPESSQAYAEAAAMDSTNVFYLQMARKCEFLRAMIEGCDVEAALASFQLSSPPWKNEVECRSDVEDLLHTAFGQLSGFGHKEAAAKVGRKHLEMCPDNSSLKYLLDAVTGDSRADRSPRDYVVQHFDLFAAGFESQLVGTLGYDIPAKLCKAVHDRTPAGHLWDAFDAGCGTGLCGPMLRPLSRKLTGVDLSPRMLEQAGLKGVYDVLACDDIVHHLQNSRNSYDLIVAADTFIYFGDLEVLMKAIAMTLRAGGLLVFSVESRGGSGYQIQPSGRFAHSVEYVKNILSTNFELLACDDTTLRMEATGRLPGNIFVFRRRTE